MKIKVPTWRSIRPVNRAVILAYGIAIVLFIIGEIMSPGFMALKHVGTILVISSFLGFAGIGQSLVILTGGIDLSVPYIMNAGAVFLTGLFVSFPGHPFWILPVVLLGGAAVGGISGLGIAFLSIPPLVMTLGMNSVAEGLVLVYTNGTPKGNPLPIVNVLVNGNVGGVPNILIVWVLLLIIVTLLLSRTTFGRHVYAIGNNVSATYLSGVNISWTLVGIYALSGLFGAFAGIFLTGFVGYAYLGMGNDYLLSSVAAVVIGGASILGGSGKYAGTVAGAIILTVLTTLLTIANLPAAARDILYGVVILAALVLHGRQSSAEEA